MILGGSRLDQVTGSEIILKYGTGSNPYFPGLVLLLARLLKVAGPSQVSPAYVSDSLHWSQGLSQVGYVHQGTHARNYTYYSIDKSIVVAIMPAASGIAYSGKYAYHN